MKRALLCIASSVLVAASAPAPAGHPFDATKLRIARDSFDLVLRATGPQPVGYLVHAVTRDSNSYRVIVENDIGGRIHQRTDMTLSASALAPIARADLIHLRSRGDLRGAIRFANGRAIGTFAASGSGSEAIDVALGPDVVDDDASTTLLATLPLADGYATSFRTFAHPGVIEATKVNVAGREVVTVPAGTFETYRLVVSARDTSHVFITTSSPRRVVLVRLLDGSAEMRLVK